MENKNKTDGKTSTESVGVTETQIRQTIVCPDCNVKMNFGMSLWNDTYVFYVCPICKGQTKITNARKEKFFLGEVE